MGNGLPLCWRRKKLLHDFRRTAVRNLERAGIARSTAMKMRGHETESIYLRYAIVSEPDLSEAAVKLSALQAGDTAKAAESNMVALSN